MTDLQQDLSVPEGDTYQVHQKRTFALYGNPLLGVEAAVAVWPHLAGRIQSIQVMSAAGYLLPTLDEGVIVQMPDRRTDLIHVMADREGTPVFFLAIEAQSTQMAAHRMPEYRHIVSDMGDRSTQLRDADGNALQVYPLVIYTGEQGHLPPLPGGPYPNFADPLTLRWETVPVIRVRQPRDPEPTPARYSFHQAFLDLECLRQDMEAARKQQDTVPVFLRERLEHIGVDLVPAWEAYRESPHFRALEHGMFRYLAYAFQSVFPEWYNLWAGILRDQGLLGKREAVMWLAQEFADVLEYQKARAVEQAVEQAGEQAGEAYRDSLQVLVEAFWGETTAHRWATRALSYPASEVLKRFPSAQTLKDLHLAGKSPMDALPHYDDIPGSQETDSTLTDTVNGIPPEDRDL